MDVNSSSSTSLKSISDSVSLLLFELVPMQGGVSGESINGTFEGRRYAVFPCFIIIFLRFRCQTVSLSNGDFDEDDFVLDVVVAVIVDTSMEGGRGRFCDFEDDSPVVVVDDDDVLFVDSEVSLNELSLLSSVIGSSNRDTPGQQNWPILMCGELYEN